MLNTVDMIVDMQYGSTGKGLLAGVLAKRYAPDTLLTAWAPNAGHTFIDISGRKFVNRMIPNGIISRNLKQILIGPGSVIDPALMESEIAQYGDYIKGARILIHPHAAVVMQDHAEWERQNMVGIGSTMKGVGAAVIHRIHRAPSAQNTAVVMLKDTSLGQFVVSKAQYDAALMRAERVLIEGAQGYSLSIYHGFYPYTTSRDVTPFSILADVGAPFDWAEKVNVFGTARTFPIRVANRYNEAGEQIGWSGPHYPDQREIKWEDISVVPELTTVTKLPRRIFTFSREQFMDAAWRCGVHSIFLNFVNYLDSYREYNDLCATIADMAGVRPRYVGVGPTENDVLDVFNAPHSEIQNRIELAIEQRKTPRAA